MFYVKIPLVLYQIKMFKESTDSGMIFMQSLW